MNAARRWSAQDAWMIGALVVAAIYAFWPAWSDLYLQAARRTDNGYIFLVPIVAFSLAWIRRCCSDAAIWCRLWD